MQAQGTKLDFSGQDIFIGLDVHLKSWKVSIILKDITYKTFSQNPDAKMLKEYLKRNFPGGTYHSAYEAGFSGFSCHRALQREGINNIVVNPADIPGTDKERKQKEDKRDSRKVARGLHNRELVGIHVPTRETEEFRGLVRYRRSLVKDINRNKSRVKSFLYYYGIELPAEFDGKSKHWSKSFTKWLLTLKLETEQGNYTLESIIDTVNFLRDRLIKTNKELRKVSEGISYFSKIQLLRTVPGVGMITAITILAELEDITRFNSLDKLCSYIGLVPTTNSSGENNREGHITPRSNRELRSMLIESSWIAIRNDPALMMSYQELCKRMEPTKAIVRIAKKLLSRIKHVLKNEQAYEKSIIG